MTAPEFVKHINKVRRESKNQWYFWAGEVSGKYVELKGFQTWLQLYRVDGVQYGNCGDRKVHQFVDDLLKPFKT